MLDTIISKSGADEEGKRQLAMLKDRLLGGTVTDCLSIHSYAQGQLEDEELATWQKEIDRYLGRPWLDIPWYFAEALYFLEILLAFGYYRSGSPGFGRDPFAPFKKEELHRPAGALERARSIVTLLSAPGGRKDILRALVYHSLWGNRIDLSYTKVLETYGQTIGGSGDALLVDHSEAIAERLRDASRVDIIADNAGSELVCDLFLAYAVLHCGESTGRQVVLHCKKEPFYVSDARCQDARTTIEALAQEGSAELRDVGQILARDAAEGRLVLADHHFWNGPLLYPELPQGLLKQLSASDVILLKGDVNYRRLLGDRKWHPTTNMESITGYFPAPFAVLRTMKSELVVDIDTETLEKLNKKETNWMVEGHYGIIRYCPER